MKNRSYLVGLSFLRLIAAWGIVGCHLNLSPAEGFPQQLLSLTDANVAIFAMISGYLLSLSLSRRKSETFKQFSYRKFIRLVVPYAFWSIVYVFLTCGYDCVYDGGRINPRFFRFSYWMELIFFGQAAAHLWYLVGLLYASIILGWIYKKCCKARIGALFIVAILSLLWAIYGGCFWSWYFGRLMAFCAWGMLFQSLSSYRLQMVCGGLSIALLAWVLPFRLPVLVWQLLIGGPVVICFSLLTVLPPIFLRISQLSMGVYCIHVSFALVASKLTARVFSAPHSIYIILSDWTIVFGASLLLAAILWKSSYFRRFVT